MLYICHKRLTRRDFYVSEHPVFSFCCNSQQCWGSAAVTHLITALESLFLHILSKSWFMHTAHIGYRFWFNLSSVGFIAYGTVNQRPIVPEGTCGGVSVLRSSFALCGFQIKVVIDEGYIKPCLNFWLLKAFKEEKMLLDSFVRVDIFQREVYTFFDGVRQFAEGVLSSSGAQQDSKNEQSKRQIRHPQPVWARAARALWKTAAFLEDCLLLGNKLWVLLKWNEWLKAACIC